MTDPEKSQDPGLRPRPRFDPVPEWVGPSTRLVHGARRPEYNAGAVVPPIYQSTTYHFPSGFSEAADRGGVYLYSRLGNPTVEVPTELLRQLEGGEAARLFGSGMGAFTSLLLSLVQSGDEVVALDVLYGGTLTVLSELLPRFGVSVRFVSEREAREPEALLTPKTRLAVLESPTNPLLTVHDIARWGKAADAVGAILVVDNTFATPALQRPIELGADIVLHSTTKYLGGHSDIIGGALVLKQRAAARRFAWLQNAVGAVPSPFDSYLVLRGLRTLGVRMRAHEESARAVAAALARHPKVRRVHYPGLASHPQHALARRQMAGYGGIVSFDLRGGRANALRFLRRLRVFTLAESLGGVESLVDHPATMTHASVPEADRIAHGVTDGLIRLSCGIEDPADLVDDVRVALRGA